MGEIWVPMIKLSKIEPNPNNPRIIKDDKFKKLVKSLKDFPKMMKLRPIVIDSWENPIPLGGNMRLRALKELGYKEIPDEWIKEAKDLTDEEKKRFIIEDNVAFGEWDFDLLANEWDVNELNEWGLEWDIYEKQEEEEGEDNIPHAEPVSMIGDLWELNNHRLLCGSSCNIDDIDKLMNGKKADLIFTDPPYDLEDEYSVFILSQAKEDCHVFIMNSDKLLIENIKNNQEHFRKMFFVDFRQARLVSNSQPMTRVDPVAEFLKGKGKFNNMRDGFSTLIECAKIHNNNAEQNHGFNQAKKVELPETFVLHYSKPNELVCDFFGGAGSTLIACEKNNRNCYLMEFDPKNVDIIVNRWIEYMKKNNKLYEVKLNGEKYDKNLFKSLETNNLVVN